MKLNGLEKYFKTNNIGEIIDFKQVEKYCNYNPLMFAFSFNQTYNLNLNTKQFDYLIKNSDLNQVSKYGMSALMYALRFKNQQNLNLTNEQWTHLINNSDLSIVDEKDLISLSYIQLELKFFDKINNLSQKIINLETQNNELKNEVEALKQKNYYKNKKII